MSGFSFSDERMYTFIKGFATALKYENTLKALNYAREKHKGQFRKSGIPYIVHPLTMVCAAISSGVHSDILLSALLLHDVIEDCNVPLTDLPVSNEIKEVVKLVTFIVRGDKEESKRNYYIAILENEYAVLVKLFDRYHNISSMAGVFTIEKIISYIKETREYVVPLIDLAKEKYPLLSNVLFGLKYQIIPLIDSLEITIQLFNNQIAENLAVTEKNVKQEEAASKLKTLETEVDSSREIIRLIHLLLNKAEFTKVASQMAEVLRNPENKPEKIAEYLRSNNIDFTRESVSWLVQVSKSKNVDEKNIESFEYAKHLLATRQIEEIVSSHLVREMVKKDRRLQQRYSSLCASYIKKSPVIFSQL